MRTELLRGTTPGAVAAIREALCSGARVYANGRHDPNGPGIGIEKVSVRKEGIRVRTVWGEWLAPGAVWIEEEGWTMSTRHTGEHPSDRLSSGGVVRFEEALELVEQELACLDRAYRIMDEGQAPILAALGHAGTVYRQEQEAARLRTVDRLRADALAAEAALDDEAARWLELLAQTLEQGDYSRLAI